MGRCDGAQVLLVFRKVTGECLHVPQGAVCGILPELWSSSLL